MHANDEMRREKEMNGPAPQGGHLRPAISQEIVNQRVETCMAALLRHGHRVTRLRRDILRILAGSSVPLTIGDIQTLILCGVVCDKVTIYRTLVLAEELQLARRVFLPGRAAGFFIASPGQHPEFLLCRACGDVRPLSHVGEFTALGRSLSEHSGFTHLAHCLEVVGICPHCRESNTQG